jgi:thymidylate synthase
VKSLYDFSDDGRTWRAGYAPRMRAFSGIMTDYNVSEAKYRNIISGFTGTVDQYKFVIDSINRDINTRQALITIADPAKDCFDLNDNLKVTKDQPCTRSLHFQVNTEGSLDMIVEIRSNDVLWGFSAVNVFNFTLMQEYFANILGLKVGRYFHIAHNIHFYKNFRDKITYFANLNPEDYKSLPSFYYQDKIESLDKFDSLINDLFIYEKMLRIEKIYSLPDLKNDMFNDWGLVLYKYWTKKDVIFMNPYLNRLFYES